MKEAFVAASVQMVSATDPSANMETATRLVAQAAAGGARLVVLPEYWVMMGRSDSDKIARRESWGQGPIQSFLADLARRHGIWLIAGTIPLECPEDDKVYNTTIVFSPEGEAVKRYDKIHLFGFSGLGESYCESATILPGHEPLKVETPLADIAFGICYDLRFPELFRALLPFDLLVLPAAFTATTGEAHWEVLLRARAIENQCYVIASAQGGEHENGRRTHGQSMIIDPWGRIVAQQMKGEGVVFGKIDPTVIQSVRTRLPALTHRVLGQTT
ncbi:MULTISPECIES: carbon-nitrogen hydrolase family protein [Gulbenkiania]|uniref:Predicted amidohydrolase n=2 Tax=Gulbenkiania TaxID=397456 RepID=A0A0K6H079_9NEIS|nr:MULTISPECIES: carbon-nitrogen hydrolase family protein [Gulbenkiania]TCW31495.1 nitrilase [Gulbenkiania mobilis]CUA84407.1 Predicted amidohydrolase [Gulbenkiania indica]